MTNGQCRQWANGHNAVCIISTHLYLYHSDAASIHFSQRLSLLRFARHYRIVETTLAQLVRDRHEFASHNSDGLVHSDVRPFRVMLMVQCFLPQIPYTVICHRPYTSVFVAL